MGPCREGPGFLAQARVDAYWWKRFTGLCSHCCLYFCVLMCFVTSVDWSSEYDLHLGYFTSKDILQGVVSRSLSALLQGKFQIPNLHFKKMKREQLKSLENIPAVTSVLPWNYFELPLLCLHMQCSSSNSPNCLTICDTDTHPFWTLLNTCWTPPRVPPSFTIASFRVAKTLP